MDNKTDNQFKIGELIEQEVRRQKMPVSVFAGLINTDRRNAYNIFKRVNIDTAMLMKISKVLNKDFFAAYSQYLNTMK